MKKEKTKLLKKNKKLLEKRENYKIQLEQRREEKKNIIKQERERKKKEYLERNSLATKNPELLKEWDYSKNTKDPTKIKATSSEIAWWRCSLGHSYDMKIFLRTGKQKCGCPFCCIPARRVLKGFNDLATKFPDLLNEWNYELNDKQNIYPNKVSPHSDKKAWWICRNCGYIWRTKIDARTRIGSGCPKCGRIKTDISRCKKVICIETNEVFNSLKEAEEKTGINRMCISNCCKGKQKKAGKYHWKYKEDI